MCVSVRACVCTDNHTSIDPNKAAPSFHTLAVLPTQHSYTDNTIGISIQVIDLHKAAIADRSGLGEPLTFEVQGPKRGWRFVADGKVRVTVHAVVGLL